MPSSASARDPFPIALGETSHGPCSSWHDRRMLAPSLGTARRFANLRTSICREGGLVGGPGMSPTEPKTCFGTKAGTYHWVLGRRLSARRVPSAVLTRGGDVIRIFFPD